jgi:hypothetical protein
MSYHQLKKDGKNTMYIATAGTVTERQTALIQRVIDKHAPLEVILADDRDAGGRKFNINYLNDLQPARAFREVADQEAYGEASRPVQWHATAGKYHTNLRVEYRHENTQEAAERIKTLTGQVERMNAGQEEPSIELKVQRTTEKDTVLKLSVAKADTAQLEIISQELYRQREQLRPEQERHPANFIRVEYPIAKDFNRDLELATKGLTADQIREQARQDGQDREAQRLIREQQRAEARRQDQAVPREHPQARQEKKVLPVAGPASPYPGNAPGSEKQVIIKVEEKDKGEGVKGQAEAVKESLERSGAKVGDIQSVSNNGARNSEMKVSYRTNQEEIDKISRTLDALGRQNGNQVIEHHADRAERQELARKVGHQRPAQQEIGR